LQQASISFDVSVNEIFPILSSGGGLVLADSESLMDFNEMMRVMANQKVSIMGAAPSLLARLNALEWELPRLRVILSGGEALTYAHVDRLTEIAEVINGYGPTETTICSSCYPLHENSSPNRDVESIPIGKPLMNYQLYILDGNLKPVPIGMKGELCIGGAGLARGYLNNPELTAEKFTPLPLLTSAGTPGPSTPIYRTGDLARWLPDGNVEFLGRIDRQVKIRGFRIEPGEIENHLVNHEQIREAAVVVIETETGDKNLCAYVTAEGDVDIPGLKDYLKTKVPPYMVPAYFMKLEEMPLTANGKVDRKALPVPEAVVSADYAPPTNDVEDKLVDIWAGILGMEKRDIGIDANFFELGGHSLTATVMAGKIESTWGVRLPLLEIFKTPFIRQLAVHIVPGLSETPGIAGRDMDEHLVLLRKQTDGENHLFLIHDGTGDVEGYVEFCNYLVKGVNCWGIRSPQLQSPGPRNISIPEMVTGYLGSMKKVQPHGPYFIAGWSLGGTVAFEMVRQLEAQGEKIAFFGMIDAFRPREILSGGNGGSREFTLQSELKWLKEYLPDETIKEQLSGAADTEDVWVQILGYFEANRWKSDMIKKRIPDYVMQTIPNSRRLDTRQLISHLNTERTLHSAWARYVPEGKIDTQVHFFKADQQQGESPDDWIKFCGKELKYYDVKGDHFSIFKKPRVTEFAKIFNKALHEVSENGIL
jgi:thioesterase domain-containing protein/acyl carrier protein